MPLDVVREPQPTKLQEPAIAGLLSQLFSAASLSSASAYLYLHSFNIKEFERYAASATHTPDQPFPVPKYSQYQGAANVTLSLQSVKALQTVPPFVGPAELYHVFVYLDATTLIPYQTASLLSTCFIKGLTTRLLLQRYAAQWQNLGVTLDLTLSAAAPPGTVSRRRARVGAQPMNASDWIAAYLNALSKALLVTGTWTALGQSDYCRALPLLTPATVQAVGMIKGWITGDALVAANADYGTYEPVIWQWLNSRYTTRQLGVMAGYTFTYLAGFLSSERTQGLINGQVNPPAQLQGITNIEYVFSDLTLWDHNRSTSFQYEGDSAFLTANGLFELVNGEFYAVAQQAQFPNRARALSNHQAFLNGFVEGITQGAQVMFVDLFDAGWDLGYGYGYSAGYSAGFQSGYSQGYSTGYQEGYAVGYNAGQPTWMSGLQTIVNDIGSVVNDVKTIGTILSDANIAGQILATIF